MVSRDYFVTMLMQAWNDQMDLTQIIDECGRLEQGGEAPLSSILYQTWLKRTHSPHAHFAWFNQGATLSNLGELVGAEEAYRHAIALAPGFIQPRLNLGLIMERQGSLDKAVEEWEWIDLNVSADSVGNKEFLIIALNNLGRILEVRKQYKRSLDYLTKSLALDPNQGDALHHWVYLRQKQCCWPVYLPDSNVSVESMQASTSALAMIAMTDDPAVQLAAARRFSEKKVLQNVPPLAENLRYDHQKIRIGYCSSDFCLHPVSMLMVELFELHDRDNFKIYGYCWSPEDGSETRKRVIAAMDQFHRIHNLSDKEAAKLIRSHEIDILVDLHGQTSGARMNMLAYRPAPIQITYLGLPATTGLKSIDYVIADRYLIPEEEAQYYSEKMLYMPDVYQVSDRKRPEGPTPTRESCGLPEDAFVFCSFNNNFKYTPEMFGVWMNVLRRVSNSVLWLLADNEWAEANLRREAVDRNIDPARLIFASRVSPENYLARYRIADLFLDSFPFNAGTTANDALWMGLPVLTLSGRTFASRMAGALLTAAGLPDMITNDTAGYEERAVRLAQEPTELQRIRSHLVEVRECGVLFDTPRFAKCLEQRLLELTSHCPTTVPPPPLALRVEGWRGINHSFAMVNQFQLLELAKRPDIAIDHVDAPLHYAHWSTSNNGAGFDVSDEALLRGIPTAETSQVADWTYRIFSPIDLRPPTAGGRLAVFIVTELGLDSGSLVPGSVIRQFEDQGGVVVTPSRWSRNSIIDFGFSSDNVHVIPHAASPKYFHPLPAEILRSQRQALGFADDELVLLNIGAAVWNKGIDVLLRAFAIARSKRKDLRLVFKDQRNTYGIAGDTFVQSTLANAGLLSDDVLHAITLIPANLTMNQMNSMYGLADCYVSSYRAEGYNLPVCEALACGTPVIVTAGGATDDFANGPMCRQVRSTLYKNVTIQDKKISAYCEPDQDHLVELILDTAPKALASGPGPSGQQSGGGWHGPVAKLVALLVRR